MKFCFNIYFTCAYQYELFGYFVKRGDNGIIAFILGDDDMWFIISNTEAVTFSLPHRYLVMTLSSRALDS